MKKKAGIVLVVGRPNVGKSTFLNNILNHKVSITSPKPQTTRFAIEAVYEDYLGQLLFIDTPGVLKKSPGRLAKTVHKRVEESMRADCDVVLYMVDRSRHRDFEEGRVLGYIRNINKPVVLVINKIDIKKSDYSAEYAFIKSEVEYVHEISALYKKHLKPLLNRLFSYATRSYPIVDMTKYATPAINMDSRMYLQEIIREKVYIFTKEELPYRVGVSVDKVIERNDKLIYIKAVVYTSDNRYKKMLIGKDGRMITEIGRAARKELEGATQKKVYLDIKVVVDPHWQEILA